MQIIHDALNGFYSWYIESDYEKIKRQDEKIKDQAIFLSEQLLSVIQQIVKDWLKKYNNSMITGSTIDVLDHSRHNFSALVYVREAKSWQRHLTAIARLDLKKLSKEEVFFVDKTMDKVKKVYSMSQERQSLITQEMFAEKFFPDRFEEDHYDKKIDQVRADYMTFAGEWLEELKQDHANIVRNQQLANVVNELWKDWNHLWVFAEFPDATPTTEGCLLQVVGRSTKNPKKEVTETIFKVNHVIKGVYEIICTIEESINVIDSYLKVRVSEVKVGNKLLGYSKIGSSGEEVTTSKESFMNRIIAEAIRRVDSKKEVLNLIMDVEFPEKNEILVTTPVHETERK
ncbi:Uncharacterized protein PRO82_001672 [Candidatus Protochlamydia amoebophila]|uniref:hypothetical protein n=1 Tax=Candidatus Protochlamydia amoebophila TaxID=362787 RepID=UPI001BC97718|nr:hypothetical protein [Candidatus Protochlamydia amoebophila]MBS4164349.1 Uncharacterized protein [Candidatus Protochlamydia amoebophila]